MPRPRRSDVMYEKARKLVYSRRVEFLGNGAYNVIGDHGTYTVVQDYTGKLSCNCQGYLQKQMCSHIAAVALLTKSRHRH
ncbi:MAG: SWIM zinc finger family protein [Candidatus Bathyarchaeota archaeon]|nr:SWIM zinc finger family protein [Candidatus Bathyarchaeota archaeon]